MCLSTCQQNIFLIVSQVTQVEANASHSLPFGARLRHSSSANSTGFVVHCHQVGSVAHLLDEVL
jgi:hypothetical protein